MIQNRLKFEALICIIVIGLLSIWYLPFRKESEDDELISNVHPFIRNRRRRSSVISASFQIVNS